MKGKLIVIEGSDGAGKTTQLGLLQAYLESIDQPVKAIDFPRYASFYGRVIARFLNGEFGELNDINPYLISVIYALDRAQAKEEMEKTLLDGKILLANRYATSNLAHQTARLPLKKRKAFMEWDQELEYKINKIPKEDLVIFLYVPYQISLKLFANKDRRRPERLKQRDITEENIEYLKSSEEAYLSLCRKFSKIWVKIDCVNDEGYLRSKEDIHQEIKGILKTKGVLNE